MEQHIAIDNVCAWPNLTMMPGGRIVATIFNQPAHGTRQGDVECWESIDEGRSWQRCGVPAPHDEATSRLNVAAGLARDGAFLVLASGFQGESFRLKRPVRKVSESDLTVVPCWVCRSRDGGRTWTRSETFPPPQGRSAIIPFGKVVQLPDGALGVTGYAYNADKTNAPSYFYRSRDDGRTWGEPSVIGPHHNETDILDVDGGRLIAVARTDGEGRLDLFESEDGGRTWHYREPRTGPWQHPPHLQRLADGRVLLSYGIRHRGLYAVGAQASDDGGRKWTPPMLLFSLEDAWDGGYPSSVQLDDGRILTAYYSSPSGIHPRYHMGVIRWNLDEQMQRNRRNQARTEEPG